MANTLVDAPGTIINHFWGSSASWNRGDEVQGTKTTQLSVISSMIVNSTSSVLEYSDKINWFVYMLGYTIGNYCTFVKTLDPYESFTI